MCQRLCGKDCCPLAFIQYNTSANEMSFPNLLHDYLLIMEKENAQLELPQKQE